jgi:hypothetical protein
MNITPLQEGKEFETLKVLSEAIPHLLERTDAVFFDTCFLCNGVISFNEYGSDELRRYERLRKNEHSQLDILSLLRLQHEHELGQCRVDMDLVNDLMRENLSRSDKLLATLEDLAAEDDVFISDVVHHETSRLYSTATKALRHYKKNKPFKKYNNHAKTNRKSRRDARKSRIVENEIFDQYKGKTDTGDLTEHVKKNLTRLSNILTTLDSNGKIILSSNLYPHERRFCDHNIIDSAMSYTAMGRPAEKVGIITNDFHFGSKINDVRRLRNNKGLHVPVTILVTANSNLEGYCVKGYTKRPKHSAVQQSH